MQPRTLALMACLATPFLVLGVPGARVQAQVSEAPQGFVPLFNGKDLSGWHGMPHFDPRKLAAMSEEDRAAKIAKDTADAKGHWRGADGGGGNDGHGPYLTTDKEYGDIELLIDYKTVPKADSGIYL